MDLSLLASKTSTVWCPRQLNMRAILLYPNRRPLTWIQRCSIIVILATRLQVFQGQNVWLLMDKPAGNFLLSNFWEKIQLNSCRYGPDISCEPRSCGQPSDPQFGWHAGECYTFGCRITYHCGEGYELVGKQAADCQADGAWSPKELPTCVCK